MQEILPICVCEGIYSKPLQCINNDETIEKVVEYIIKFRKNKNNSITVNSFNELLPNIPILVISDSNDEYVNYITYIDVKYFDDNKNINNVDKKTTDIYDHLLQTFQLPIKIYLQKYKDLKYFYYVYEKTTLKELFEIFIRYRVEYVWIVNSTYLPQSFPTLSINSKDCIGIITIKNILHWLAKDHLWLRTIHLKNLCSFDVVSFYTQFCSGK